MDSAAQLRERIREEIRRDNVRRLRRAGWWLGAFVNAQGREGNTVAR